MLILDIRDGNCAIAHYNETGNDVIGIQEERLRIYNRRDG